MFNRLFGTKFNSISSAAIVIGAAGLVSRILGVIRDRVLASQFGAGDELDIYYAAFRVPDFVFNLIVLGALSAGFIPIFVSLIRNDDPDKNEQNKEAWSLANNVLNVLAVLLILLGLILVLFSPWLVPIITPGFDAQKMSLTVQITQLMFFSPLLLGLSGVFGGILQSFKRFLAFSLAPIMYNLGIIFGAIFLTKDFGVFGLAYGVIIGAVLHLLIQIPACLRLGYRYKLYLKLKDNKFLQIVKMMGPRILGLASTQVNLIVITILASTLAAGSLAIFNLANNLQNFPIGLFGISYAIAVFPLLSEKFAKGASDTDFLKPFLRTFKQILFFIIPLSALFVILRIQIVRVVLGAGKFNWDDTILTADSLGLFALSLFAQATIPLLVRAFYARHNSVIPFVASFVSVVINIFLSLWLIERIGVLGLALGFTISSIINFVILVMILQIKLEYKKKDDMLQVLFNIVFATIVMGILVQTVKTYLGSVVDMNRFWGVFIQALISGVVGVVVYGGVLYLFKSEQLFDFIEGFKKKFLRKVKPQEESIRHSGEF